MDEIDIIMARLHATSLPVGLASLDGAALASEARSRVAATRNYGAVAAVAALILGVAGSALPTASAEVSTAMSLGAVSAFAPSALLAN